MAGATTFTSPIFDFTGDGGIGQLDTLGASAIQSNEKVVVAGGHGLLSGGDVLFGLARFKLDGSLDSGFGSEGIVTTDIPGGALGACAVLIQSDGKIVAMGTTNNSVVLARYLAQQRCSG
jgi:hypothetical protein